jgi:uncharacterized protein (DUF427 family)
MNDYPAVITPINHVEPVPRRIRAFVGPTAILDTLGARYVWEVPYYPQYYIPVGDVRAGVLVPEGRTETTDRGKTEWHALHVDGVARTHAAQILTASEVSGLDGTVHFEWSAADAWFEEDEQVFVHPRNPYVRVDALRSTRPVRVELDGVVLAESGSPVMVFETGLPTRYYLNRTDVDFTRLEASHTVTQCPYKGTTSGYWSAHVGNTARHDLAWAYDFPTRELLPIAGLIAFYNEKVDLFLDGRLSERPTTLFSRGTPSRGKN